MGILRIQVDGLALSVHLNYKRCLTKKQKEKKPQHNRPVGHAEQPWGTCNKLYKFCKKDIK